MPQSVAEKRREVENNLRYLGRQAEEMDAKIRAYLSDRDNKPHPRHQEFIKKIQNLRIDPSVSTRYLETLLDNLQWKVYHFSRAWSQLWENSKAARASEKQEYNPARNSSTQSGDQPKIYSVDRLWQIQQQKLSALGNNGSEPENKEAFVQRIKERYGKLASEKKNDEEIVMTFDKQNMRCTLVVKKLSRSSEK
jgi:hypothetical protein